MKLLVFDIEGTLFKTKIRLPGTNLDSTIWQSLASALGPEAVEAEVNTHHKWRIGGYQNYLEWMKDTISIHRQFMLSRKIFNSIVSSAEYNDGVLETFRGIDRNKYQIVLVSGGFRELAIRAQRDLDIIHAFAACEYIFDRRGKLCGFNLLPCDFAGKIDFIQLMLREYRIDSGNWIFVGDGANDVPIATEAPISVGYRPHPELMAVTDYQINCFTELLTILNK